MLVKTGLMKDYGFYILMYNQFPPYIIEFNGYETLSALICWTRYVGPFNTEEDAEQYLKENLCHILV